MCLVKTNTLVLLILLILFCDLLRLLKHKILILVEKVSLKFLKTQAFFCKIRLVWILFLNFMLFFMTEIFYWKLCFNQVLFDKAAQACFLPQKVVTLFEFNNNYFQTK